MQASQDQLGEPFQSIISSDLCAWCIYSLHDIENRRWFVSIIARGEAVYYKQFMLSLFNNFNPSPPPILHGARVCIVYHADYFPSREHCFLSIFPLRETRSGGALPVFFPFRALLYGYIQLY